MYEYAFYKINTGMNSGEYTEDYQDVIRDFAERGWRLVQVFSLPGIGLANPSHPIELIFEREMQEAPLRQDEVLTENGPLLYSLDVQAEEPSIFKLSTDINLQDLIATVVTLKENNTLKEQDLQELVQDIKNLDLAKRMYGIRREDYLKDIRSIAEKIEKLVAEKRAAGS